MPSTSSKVLGLMVMHTKQITTIEQIPDAFQLRVLRSKALQEVTNSGLRARLARLGLDLIVEPDLELRPSEAASEVG